MSDRTLVNFSLYYQNALVMGFNALMPNLDDPWAAALQAGELTSQGLELEGR
ncbi:hypothetical protein [Vibrio sp. WJH972]